MFCPNCGANIEDGTKFCPDCGAPVTVEPAPAPSEPQQDFMSNNEADFTQQDDQAGYSQQEYQQTYEQQGYQQPYGNAPVGGGTNRNTIVCIVLCFVTCGIYGIYWMIKMNDEINMLNGTPEDTSGVMVFILTLVTCGIYGLYWVFKMGEKVDNIKTGMGEAPSSIASSVLFLLLAVFGLSIVDYYFMQETINKASM